MSKKKKASKHPIRQEVAVCLVDVAIQLQDVFNVMAQLDTEQADQFGIAFCESFARALSAGLVGATPTQLKTLPPQLNKIATVLAGMAALAEDLLVRPPLKDGFVAPTTSKAQ